MEAASQYVDIFRNTFTLIRFRPPFIIHSQFDGFRRGSKSEKSRPHRGSNTGQHDLQSYALTTELWSLTNFVFYNVFDVTWKANASFDHFLIEFVTRLAITVNGHPTRIIHEGRRSFHSSQQNPLSSASCHPAPLHNASHDLAQQNSCRYREHTRSFHFPRVICRCWDTVRDPADVWSQSFFG